ncbi:MAG: hypothetical protein RBU37_16240 [Myxococcota bacterium]|jgi:hypothetical protein|nr:hypothetical protein [Myxococcota bacterium]
MAKSRVNPKGCEQDASNKAARRELGEQAKRPIDKNFSFTSFEAVVEARECGYTAA